MEAESDCTYIRGVAISGENTNRGLTDAWLSQDAKFTATVPLLLCRPFDRATTRAIWTSAGRNLRCIEDYTRNNCFSLRYFPFPSLIFLSCSFRCVIASLRIESISRMKIGSVETFFPTQLSGEGRTTKESSSPRVCFSGCNSRTENATFLSFDRRIKGTFVELNPREFLKLSFDIVSISKLYHLHL